MEGTTDKLFSALLDQYGRLSSNKLEKTTAERFADEVKGAVKNAQQLADGIINALSGTVKIDVKGNRIETPADVEAAKGKLLDLAKSVEPVVMHWRPFIDATASFLNVDLRLVRSTNMVPDSEKLEHELEEQQSANIALQAELDKADGIIDGLQQSLKTKDEALEQGIQAVKDAQAAAGALTTENQLLKAKLVGGDNAKPAPEKK